MAIIYACHAEDLRSVPGIRAPKFIRIYEREIFDKMNVGFYAIGACILFGQKIGFDGYSANAISEMNFKHALTGLTFVLRLHSYSQLSFQHRTAELMASVM